MNRFNWRPDDLEEFDAEYHKDLSVMLKELQMYVVLKDFIPDLTQQALDNKFFRRVVDTTKHTQVAVMSILVAGDVGAETHNDVDQVTYVVAGQCNSVLDGVTKSMAIGDMVVVPRGTEHNFVNVGKEPMKLIVLYSPPDHAPGTVHKTKLDAQKDE